MKALARQKIWWPGIDKDIELVRKQCKICQSNGPEERHVPLHPWEIPSKPWQRLHADFAGLFLGSMWLIVVDAKSKWPEVIKMGNISAENTIKALRQLFFQHGMPEQIVTDNGAQFTSSEFEKFCKERGIVHTLTPPYHPMSNGEAERMVQSFKSAMKLLREDGYTPDAAKDQFLLRYRVTPHTATGISPAEMLCGRKLRTMLDLVFPSQIFEGEGKKENKTYSERTKRNFDRKTREKRLQVGQKVFARNYREGPKWIQGKILSQIGSAMFSIRTARGVWRRHFDQLKADVTKDDNASDSGEDSDIEEDLEENVPPVPIIPVEPQVEVRRSARPRKPKQMFDPS
jgi:hypothetical protein